MSSTSPELNFAAMTLGERIVFAAQLATRQHLLKSPGNDFERATSFCDVPATTEVGLNDWEPSEADAGGAGATQITDDQPPATTTATRLRRG